MENLLHLGTTKTLLIVYHSVTGGTRQMVEAAARGAALYQTA
jgi:flavodoxin